MAALRNLLALVDHFAEQVFCDSAGGLLDEHLTVAAKGMDKAEKILLVVDAWMLRYDAGSLLGGLGLEGIETIFYHVTDYTDAIASSAEPYNETILPGAGITPVDQFIAERKMMMDAFLSRNPARAPRNVEIDIHPQPAAKILEKADSENADLIMLWIRDRGPERSYKSSLIETIARRSSCLVVAVSVKEVSDTATRIRGPKIETRTPEVTTQNTKLYELRRGVYTTANHTPLICTYCRHALDLHTGRHCSICEIFPDSSVERRCLSPTASNENAKER